MGNAFLVFADDPTLVAPPSVAFLLLLVVVWEDFDGDNSDGGCLFGGWLGVELCPDLEIGGWCCGTP